MGVKRSRDKCERLQRKRHFAIIPEERCNGAQLGGLPLEKKISYRHLSHPQHTPPSRVRLVIRTRKDFFDVATIGEADELLIVLYLLGGEECEQGS